MGGNGLYRASVPVQGCTTMYGYELPVTDASEPNKQICQEVFGYKDESVC